MVKYSDRYEEPVEVMPSLTDAEQKERLNPAFFPTAIWQAFFEKQPKQRWSSLQTRSCWLMLSYSSARKKDKKKAVQSLQQTFAAVDAQTAERKAGKVRYVTPCLLNILILACRTARGRTRQTSKMKRMSTSSMTTRYVCAIFRMGTH